MRITKELMDRALEAIGDDVEIAQMIGLKPYWGHDTSTESGRRTKKPIKVVREPEIIPPEEYVIEVQKLDRHFFKGFNRGIRLMPIDPISRTADL